VKFLRLTVATRSGPPQKHRDGQGPSPERSKTPRATGLAKPKRHSLLEPPSSRSQAPQPLIPLPPRSRTWLPWSSPHQSPSPRPNLLTKTPDPLEGLRPGRVSHVSGSLRKPCLRITPVSHVSGSPRGQRAAQADTSGRKPEPPSWMEVWASHPFARIAGKPRAATAPARRLARAR